MTITGNIGVYPVLDSVPSIISKDNLIEKKGIMDRKLTDFLILESRDSGREILIHRKADLKEFEKRKILKAIAKSLEENKSIDLIDLSEEISSKNIPTNSKEDKKDEESETFLIKKDNILLKGKNASIEIKDGNIVLRTLGNVKIFGEHVDLGTF